MLGCLQNFQPKKLESNGHFNAKPYKIPSPNSLVIVISLGILGTAQK